MGDHITPGDAPSATAPDGSTVDILAALPGLTTARFQFPAGSVSVAIRHRTVDEVWYFLSGSARFWSSSGPVDGVDVVAGVCISILAGESFQLRVDDAEPLAAFGVTSPGWPGPGEAELVDGPWAPTLTPGPL